MYKVKTRERFSNENIKDQLLRLTEDARGRIQVACIPCLEKLPGDELGPLAGLLACFIRYLADPHDAKGQEFKHSKDIAFDDLQPSAMKSASSCAVEDVKIFLETAFPSLASTPDGKLAHETASLLKILKDEGIIAMLKRAACRNHLKRKREL